MNTGPRVLLAWERNEENSWNPVLAQLLREHGSEVAEVHDLEQLRAVRPESFDVCLPRFRVGAANMTTVDDELVRSRLPMLNSRRCRAACENKAIAHLAFERSGVPQPRSLVVSREGLADREHDWEGETVVKPLYGNRSAGVEILGSADAAVARAVERGGDLLVQQLIWPARCWRVVVGRSRGAVDPYWRRPPAPDDRILSISTGSEIVREPVPEAVEAVAVEMNAAVGGDLLAADVLERDGEAFALEINHNFDAHGGDAAAAAAFRHEIAEKLALAPV